jgi:hypothetical protein
MAADFGCFKLRARMPGGDEDALLAYGLAPRDPAVAEEAWPLLTGRVINPRGRMSMFSENDPPEHRAKVQRIIRSHQVFGGDELLLWFDWQMQLVRVEDLACREVLWRSMDDQPPMEENAQRLPLDPPARMFIETVDAQGIGRRVK